MDVTPGGRLLPGVTLFWRRREAQSVIVLAEDSHDLSTECGTSGALFPSVGRVIIFARSIGHLSRFSEEAEAWHGAAGSVVKRGCCFYAV